MGTISRSHLECVPSSQPQALIATLGTLTHGSSCVSRSNSGKRCRCTNSGSSGSPWAAEESGELSAKGGIYPEMCALVPRGVCCVTQHFSSSSCPMGSLRAVIAHTNHHHCVSRFLLLETTERWAWLYTPVFPAPGRLKVAENSSPGLLAV